MIRNPHPSGRPVRRSEIKRHPAFRYTPDPAVIYATARLRPRTPLPMVDAIGYLRVEPHADEDHVE
jgi:hypothetical protein